MKYVSGGKTVDQCHDSYVNLKNLQSNGVWGNVGIMVENYRLLALLLVKCLWNTLRAVEGTVHCPSYLQRDSLYNTHTLILEHCTYTHMYMCVCVCRA